MRRVLKDAINEYPDDPGLAFMLFSQWSVVRYTPEVARAMKSWASLRLPLSAYSVRRDADTQTTTQHNPRAGDEPSPAHKGVDA
jgi:hypothetical protein